MPRAEAKRRIVAATATLLRKRRYNTLTIEQVMAEAGLARTVFYRYFDGSPTCCWACSRTCSMRWSR